MSDLQPFQAMVADEGDTVTVIAFGELDQGGAPELSAVLDRFLHRGAGRLVVDFSGVSFCDCSGLRALLQGREQARARGVIFELMGARAPVVTRLLALTGCDAVFGLDCSA